MSAHLTTPISERLLASGSRFLRSSLHAYDGSHWDVFALHAGAAVEHLMKACLAAVNPALIAKRDHLQSIIWFADPSRCSSPMHPDLRTITFEESGKLLQMINTDVNKHNDILVAVQRARNSAAHLGPASANEAQELLPKMLRLMNLLIEAAGGKLNHRPPDGEMPSRPKSGGLGWQTAGHAWRALSGRVAAHIRAVVGA